MATNVLNFGKAGIAHWVAFVAGVLGVDCAAGEGSMSTGRGLFFGLAVALGSKFMGIG